MRTIPATALFVCCVLSLPATSAHAQFGPPSGERLVQFIDRNGDGTVDQAELDQVSSRMRGWLESSGVDLSRPMKSSELADQIQERFESRRREMERRDDDGDGDRDRSWGGRSSYGRGGYGSSDGERRSDGGPSRKPASKPAPKPRVTVSLPDQYKPGDANADGQIGLYEWLTWKGRAALAEFDALDRNRDGFLTPRELTASKPAAESAATASRTYVPRSSTSSSVQIAAAPASVGAATAIAASSNGTAEAARRYFGLMDRNRDGQLTTEEWSISSRIRPMFEQGGVDLTKPMAVDEFVEHYTRLSPSSAE